MRTEISCVQNALANAERVAQLHSADRDAMQTEIGYLREARDRAEAAGAEIHHTMQAEVRCLHNALADAERTAQLRAAECEAMQAEIASLREERGYAEAAEAEVRRALEEHTRYAATAVASVQDEAAALRENLRAAREVSARLLSAFRSGSSR